ncbi:MAG TPA: NAD(P)/FAD-dependent oxidoreductase [Steroidobacteraceae bacterium]|nr:NAD(P)/FAD-dependent oxidoreductase [Steroidobacteraceae bacterium]
MSAKHTDVVIVGGGLAGLTLALQLRARLPALSITVLERHRLPVPEAAHKVGESTVEIGAHYLDTVLGLGAHLRERQLRKFGFRFFFSDGRRDVDAVTELGASRYLHTPGYQLDRGILENFLYERVRAQGVQLVTEAAVRDISLAERGTHGVRYERDGATHELAAGWLVDASGRAGLLRRQLDLKIDNGHHANAAWFRLSTRIDIDDWSDDAGWHGRCFARERWLSTNHLVGPGYWVWLIPLSSGSHSVGIVADEAMHPLREYNSFDRALAWLRRHQPRLAECVEQSRGELQDFVALRHFSYGCKRVFSAQRWALTGEAGLFLDPFYSPGTDFIAISNTYITDLIARERAGESIEMHAHLYEQIYFSFYESTLALYRDQYPLFGDAEVMPSKVIWDYAYYWGILCQFFFQHRLTDIVSMSRLKRELGAAQVLNLRVQELFRRWSRAQRPVNPSRMLDQAALPWFAELNRSLADPLSEAEFLARMRRNTALLHELAAEILARARAAAPAVNSLELESAICAFAAPTAAQGLLFRPAA